MITTSTYSQTTVGFSRGNPSAKQVVLNAINEAQSSIYLAAYQFTSPDILNALVAAKDRGVNVQILLDRSNQNKQAASILVSKNIGCYIDNKFRIMHLKVMIIDSIHVETGSFNYTVNADKFNAENALYIKNVPELAIEYQIQWNKIQSTSKLCSL